LQLPNQGQTGRCIGIQCATMKICFSILCAAMLVHQPSAMSQTAKTPGQDWLQAAPTVPEFAAPASRQAWQTQRESIRQQLWQLLGKMPDHTKIPDVTTLSREERDGYILEKFQFANGAGAMVPGYVFLPKKSAGKAPAILYCHWHGGQYEVGKEEMLRTNATPVAAGPELAKRGFVVLGIDAYCFGERNGKGPWRTC
jgi:hypothetical protein